LITPYQDFIRVRTYSRWNEELGRRETWDETVDRYDEFFWKILWDKRISAELKDAYSKAIDAIRSMDVMPSMRCLWTAGPALERENISGYNCAYVAVDNPRVFAEILYILMCGTGVGFSVERQYINKLPEVVNFSDYTSFEPVIVFEDSKLGWAEGFQKCIETLYAGCIPIYDLSKIRPKGSRLKIFGGRASGPEPLKELIDFTIQVFKNAQGRKLNSIECYDIVCKIANCVVSGGVRRSATLSLSNLTDLRMRHAKDGQFWIENPQRALSNNSVAYTEKPDMRAFMEEWMALVESKSGERGIVNREALKNTLPKRRNKDFDFGVNPCFHPDTIIETVHGRMRIADIKEPIKVYSMDTDGSLCIKQASAAWKTRENAETLKITICNGYELTVTPDHKIFIKGKGWVEAKDLKLGDKVVMLIRNRRGAAYSGIRLTSEPRSKTRMEHRLVFEGVYGAIPSGYDIHHLDGDTYNNDADNLVMMPHSEHARLTAYTQPNNHQLRDPITGNFISPPVVKGKTIIPLPEELKTNLHQYPTITKIEAGEVTDVYDISVEDTHNVIANGIVAHNCGEIVLRPRQFCNLTEVVVRPEDTLEDLCKKVKHATILGCLQSTLTDFKFLSEEWKKNCEEERLLGVSLTGLMDHPVLQKTTMGDSFLSPEEWLEVMKQTALDTVKVWSKALGINMPAAITCVKPSGTVSQLVDSSSGLHPRYAPYYIRRVRVTYTDPLAKFLMAKDVPCEPEVGQTWNDVNTVVFEFPVESPKGSICRKDLTALEQLEYWKMLKIYWCEHNPSVTIYVKDHEWLEVGAWVYKNWDIIGGLSFLPYDGGSYQLAPYEEITKEKYEELIKNFPKLDFSELSKYETKDETEGSRELACTAGVCEL
jgi:hypothetical protein